MNDDLAPIDGADETPAYPPKPASSHVWGFTEYTMPRHRSYGQAKDWSAVAAGVLIVAAFTVGGLLAH